MGGTKYTTVVLLSDHEYNCIVNKNDPLSLTHLATASNHFLSEITYLLNIQKKKKCDSLLEHS